MATDAQGAGGLKPASAASAASATRGDVGFGDSSEASAEGGKGLADDADDADTSTGLFEDDDGDVDKAVNESEPASVPAPPVKPVPSQIEPIPIGEVPTVSGSAAPIVPLPANEPNSRAEIEQSDASEKSAVALSATDAPAAGIPVGANPNTAKPRLILKNPPTSKIEAPRPARRNPASLERALGFNYRTSQRAAGYSEKSKTCVGKKNNDSERSQLAERFMLWANRFFN